MKKHLLSPVIVVLFTTTTCFAQKDSVHKGSFAFCRCHILLSNQPDTVDFTLSPTKDRIDTIPPGFFSPLSIRLNPSCKSTSILRFEIMASYNGLLGTFYTNTSYFSPEMQSVLYGLAPGEHFVIEHVCIRYPNGKCKEIPGETVVIAKQ